MANKPFLMASKIFWMAELWLGACYRHRTNSVNGNGMEHVIRSLDCREIRGRYQYTQRKRTWNGVKIVRNCLLYSRPCVHSVISDFRIRFRARVRRELFRGTFTRLISGQRISSLLAAGGQHNAISSSSSRQDGRTDGQRRRRRGFIYVRL